MRLKIMTSAALAAILICGSPALAGAAPDNMAVEASASRQLAKLFAESDTENLKRNPLVAIYRGTPLARAGLGPLITDGYYEAERRAAEADLARLGRIDRNALSPDERISLEAFKSAREEMIDATSPEILRVIKARPLNHFTGLHDAYLALASGEGALRYRTAQDYRDGLRRHQDYARFLDASIARFREGLAQGLPEHEIVIRNMIDQLDGQLATSLDKSEYLRPVQNFPDTVPAGDREPLKLAYEKAVAGEIYPALKRLRDYLANEYLPKARAEAGLWSLPGGAALYRHYVRVHTNQPLDPGLIHAAGLSEVARIMGRMDEARRDAGFDGSLKDFFQFLRTDPRFRPASRDQLTQGYYEIARRLGAHLPAYFSKTPSAKLDIKPYEPNRERFLGGGSYEIGPADGSRPATFYFNAYDLASRTTFGMTALYLHEGAPGHHFQMSLAQENTKLPSFLRFSENTAFVEGWALYAESLGYEMGLYDDPYQRMGALNLEMQRALRLVVDTGIHAKSWSRAQAIDYMLENSSMSRAVVTAEVDRYIAWPGQALSYKMGAMKIGELRSMAKERLGARFNLRDFHDQLLLSGAVPLPVLEAKIVDWVEGRLKTHEQTYRAEKDPGVVTRRPVAALSE